MRLRKAILCPEERADVAVKRRDAGFEDDGLAKAGKRAFRIPTTALAHRAIGPDGRMAYLEAAHQPVKFGKRVLVATLLVQVLREVCESVESGRIRRDCPSEHALRSGQIAA